MELDIEIISVVQEEEVEKKHEGIIADMEEDILDQQKKHRLWGNICDGIL